MKKKNTENNPIAEVFQIPEQWSGGCSSWVEKGLNNYVKKGSEM
jgi:hypothetical protein